MSMDETQRIINPISPFTIMHIPAPKEAGPEPESIGLLTERYQILLDESDNKLIYGGAV